MRGLSTLYYMTPPLVLAVIALTLGLITFLANKKNLASTWLSTSIGCIIWMLCTSISVPAPLPEGVDPKQEKIRVVFWNAARGLYGWDNLLAEAKALDPDILAMVETGPSTEEKREMWKAQFPEHRVSMLGGGFMLLTRGYVSDCTPSIIGDMGEMRTVDISYKNLEFRLAIVDIASHPLRDRRTTLEALAEYAKSQSYRPLMIMGDFNTPTDSRHLLHLRDYCTNAFELAGTGYGATWPVPVPLLILDQVWVNSYLIPSSARLGWTGCSDHRPVVVELMNVFRNSHYASKVSSLELLPPEEIRH